MNSGAGGNSCRRPSDPSFEWRSSVYADSVKVTETVPGFPALTVTETEEGLIRASL